MIVHNKQNHLNHQRLDKAYYAKAKALRIEKKRNKQLPRGIKSDKPTVL